MTTTSETQQKAKAATSATADESRHLGHVAGQEAGNVAGEALNQARNLAEEAKGQLAGQGREQRDRLVDTMRTFSGDLDKMANGEQTSSGLATDLVRQASERTRELCERLDGREPAQILDDVRDFARRRPGTFLLGALATGIVAGRLVRGAKSDSGSSTSGSSYEQAGPAYDATQAGSSFDDSAFAEPPVTPATTATPTATVPTGAIPSTAPQPVTGPLETEEPSGGSYGGSTTGPL